MELQQQEQTNTSQEPRYDRETLGKVTRLAQHLQSRDKDSWSAAEIEQMGAEVGLQPEFIRQALSKVNEEKKPAAPKVKKTASPEDLKAWRNAWWAGGWTLPLVLFGIANVLGFSEVIQGLGVLAGGPIWIGIGVYLSSIARAAAQNAPNEPAQVGRDAMLQMLDKLHSSAAVDSKTVLSIAPSVELARDGTTQALLEWIRTICRVHHSDSDMLTGQCVEALFRSPADAAAAARSIQDGIAKQPGSPSLRCGIAMGPDAERARTEATQIQLAANPGDILTDADCCGAALPVLDQLLELPQKVAGGFVYSWRSPRAT